MGKKRPKCRLHLLIGLYFTNYLNMCKNKQRVIEFHSFTINKLIFKMKYKHICMKIFKFKYIKNTNYNELKTPI